MLSPMFHDTNRTTCPRAHVTMQRSCAEAGVHSCPDWVSRETQPEASSDTVNVDTPCLPFFVLPCGCACVIAQLGCMYCRITAESVATDSHEQDVHVG